MPNRMLSSGKTLDDILQAQRDQVQLLKELRLRRGEQIGGNIGARLGGEVGRDFGEAIGRIVVKLKMFEESVERAGTRIAPLVGSFSPGTTQRFGIVLKDMQATIGERLRPALEVIIT